MTRKHIIAFMIMMLSTSWAGYALAGGGNSSDLASASPECASPTASSGYIACTGSGVGGAIINADIGTGGGQILAMRSNPGVSANPIDVYNICRYIDNNTIQSYFIPFKTSAEWSSVKNAATSFTQVHCSRPVKASTQVIPPPPYGTCTETNPVATPQLYARYPGGTATTSGANFSCNGGSTSVSASEQWQGLDSDNNYDASWGLLKTLYGPNVILSSGGTTGSVSADVSSNVTLNWTATSSTGAGVTCTPTAWGATSSSAGSATVSAPSVAGSSAPYSITCLDSASGLTSSANITINGQPAVTAAITATPSTILVGSPTILAWTSSNATSCIINNGVNTGGATSGSLSVSPTTTTTYTVTCSHTGGSASQSTTVTVDQPVSATLTGAPTTILNGNSSLLSWSSSNATSCSIDNGIGAVATSGSRTISPTSSTTYTLTCSNPVNTSMQSTIITVDGQVTVTMNALPTTILSGRTTTLSWSSTNATSCSLDNGVGAVSTSGSLGLTPLATTTYTLTCSNPVSTASQVMTVTVDQPVSATLTPSPSTIVLGSSSTLNWSSTNATSCTLGGSAVGLTGSTVVSPTTTTGYTLVCSNAADSATQTTTVTVVQPVAATFSASPTTIALAASSTLTWAPLYATACTIDNGIGSVSATGGSQSVSPTTTTTYTLTCNDGLSGAGSSVARAVTVTVCPSGYTVVGGVCTASIGPLCLRNTALVQKDLSMDIIIQPPSLTPVSGHSSVVAAFVFSGDWVNYFGAWFSTTLYGNNEHGGAYFSPYPYTSLAGNSSADGFGYGIDFDGLPGSHGRTKSYDFTAAIAANAVGTRFDTGILPLDNFGDGLETRYTSTLVPCNTPNSVTAQSCGAATVGWDDYTYYNTFGYGSCQGTTTPAPDGAQRTVTDLRGGYTSVQQCVDGQWGYVSGHCGVYCAGYSTTDCNGNGVTFPLKPAGSAFSANGLAYTCATNPENCSSDDTSCQADLAANPVIWQINDISLCPYVGGGGGN